MHNMRRQWPIRIVVMSLSLVALGTFAVSRARGDGSERYLYVWAGDQARTAPDFLAVVDFDPTSASYSRVLATRPLPEPGAAGNEPHHVGLSTAVRDHRRVLPDSRRRLSRDDDGRRHGPPSRPRRGVRSPSPPGRRASRPPPRRGVQSPRHLRSAGIEPDGDERLNLSVDDA